MLEKNLQESRPIAGTSRDNTVGMKYSQDMHGEVLMGAAAVMVGAVAYRTGVAKHGVSKFIKLASKTSNKNLASAKAFRKWINGSGGKGTKGSLLRDGEGFRLKASDFKRLSTAGKRRELFQEMKASFKNLGSEKRINATRTDFEGLEESILNQADRLDGLQDTELSRAILDIKRVSEKLAKDTKLNDAQRNAVRNRMYEDLVTRNRLTDKQKALDMKRKNFTSLTVGDMFDVQTVKGRQELRYKGTGKQFSADAEILKRQLNKSYYTGVDGKAVPLASHKDILSLKIDNSLMTNGSEISDLRYFKNTARFVAETLSQDFKIPVIGINPFAILGGDRFSKRAPKFALLSKGTRQSGITGNTDYTQRHMFFSDGDVYELAGESAELKFVKGNMKVESIAANAAVVSRELDAVRKMEGTRRINYEEYTQDDGVISNSFGKLGKWLDFGFDDLDAHTLDELGANEWLNPNTWMAKLVGRFKRTGFMRPNKGVKVVDEINGVQRVELSYTEMFSDLENINDDDIINVAMNKTYSIMDIIRDTAKAKDKTDVGVESTLKYLGQFNAGRKNLDDVTTRTSWMHFMFDRVSSTLSMGGIGLSVDSLSSPLNVLKNLGLKRALPLYVGYNAIQFGIMLTEHDEDELGNKDNILKDMAKMVASTDLVMRKGLELFGVPDLLDGIKVALPGIDHLTEIPGINMLKLDMDYDERLDYYLNGYEEVRKNRYWDGGNQALTGCLTPESKIITQDGLIAAKDIIVNHHFTVSKDANWHKIIASKTKGADEVIYNIETHFNCCDNVWLTGNHNLLVIETAKCNRAACRCTPGRKLNQCIECKNKKYKEYEPTWKEIRDITKECDYLTIPVRRGSDDSVIINLWELIPEYRFDGDGVYCKLKNNGNFATNFSEGLFYQLLEISNVRHKPGNSCELRNKLTLLGDKHNLTVKQLKQKIDDIRKKDSKYYQEKRIHTHTGVVPVNRDLGNLLGYYAAEGCVDKSTVKFAFNASEVVYAEDVLRITKEVFGVSGSYTIRNNSLTVAINSSVFAKFINAAVPGKAKNKDKRISKWLLELTNEELWVGFIEAFIFGDGWQSKSRERITMSQSSLQMIMDIQEILLRFGSLSSINKAVRGGNLINGCYVKRGVLYDLSISGVDCKNLELIIKHKQDVSSRFYVKENNKLTHSRVGFFISEDLVAIKIKKINTKDFNGDVYDFEVEGEESFVGAYIMHNSKIDTYRPNLYRRIMADAEFSDTKWGSRWEYFSNAPFPTPLTPLAPLKHFFTDPYHYDKKHIQDRPYPVTAPIFGNVPFISGILAPIGEIIKPTKFTHPYIVNNKEINPEYLANLSIAGDMSVMFNASFGGDENVGYGDGNLTPGEGTPGELNATDGLSSIPMLNISAGGGIALSGSYEGDTQELYDIGQSGGVMSSVSTSIPMSNYGGGEVNIDGLSGTQNDLGYNAGQLYDDAANFFGLYGFMGSTVTGSPLDDMKVLENPSYAYSGSRMFWDNSVGGLGGDVNEIGRRFLRKRMDDENLINPIKNTMPEWLPGGDYHTDYKTGDAMSKISSGELRLPGQAYERLHDIKEHDLYKVDAGALTSVDSAMQSTINKTPSSTVVEGGTEAKRKVLTQFRNSGYLLDGETSITDHDRHVTSTYDGIMELGGQQGMLYVNAVDGLSSISRDQRESDIAKANFGMYASGGDTAFIQYVDATTGEMADIQKIAYDSSNVDRSMKNMVKARETIKDNIDKGLMSNGDLYAPIDKLRILADTAPYSDEYRAMRSYVSKQDLTEDEREEVSAMEERVQNVKKPLRTYDYKYKGRGTTTDEKIVASVVGRGMFTVYGDNAVYKLAGVSLSAQEEPAMQHQLDKLLDEYLHTGSSIKVEFDDNPALRNKGGSNRVIVHRGSNTLQGELLDKGFAKHNTSKDPIDMRVKTNGMQRAVGSVWERFAHLDTPFHSKFLRVRSAKEDYERSRVYSKQFTDWRSPFSDYLRPLLFDRNVGRGTVSGLVMGTTVGAMFGKTKAGTIVGAGLGFASVLIGKVFTEGYETAKGETWRPKRVRDEQNLYDYMDKMKYLKYRRLYHAYADVAKKEGVDVRSLVGASYNMKSKKRVKSGWMNDYKVSSSKLHALGVPEFLTRLLNPRADLNASGLITNEMPSLFDNLARKMMGTFREVGKSLGNGGRTYDESSADKVRETLFDRLGKMWSGEVLEAESKLNHKKFLSGKQSRIKDNRLLVPLREEGIFKGDRQAPVNKELGALMDAKVALSSSTREGATDKTIARKIKDSGVVPVYKGTLGKRHIDVNQTMMLLNEKINETAKRAGYSIAATKAMQYYKLSEATMHAYDQGDSISEVTSAMPKKDRDYFREFLTAPDHEKLAILDLAPKYMRRPLEAAWGLDVEKKDDLNVYYKDHALPDERWEGWREDVSLDSVKVKMAKKEKLEFSDVNIWKNDVAAANASGKIPVPKLNYKSSGITVKNKLSALMGKLGYEDINFNTRGNSSQNKVDLYLKYNKKSEYAGQIEGMMGSNI